MVFYFTIFCIIGILLLFELFGYVSINRQRKWFIFLECFFTILIKLIGVLTLRCVRWIHYLIKLIYTVFIMARLFRLLDFKKLAVGVYAICLVGVFHLDGRAFFIWNNIWFRVFLARFLLYSHEIFMVRKNLFMERFNAANHCPLSLLFYHLQSINCCHFLYLIILGSLFMFGDVFGLFLLFLLMGWLFFSVLHKNKFLKILNLLPHVTNNFILPLDLWS